ncbi:MAG: DUF1579 family protein [Phycisphaerae bacterium]
MSRRGFNVTAGWVFLGAALAGCAAPKVDFSQIQRPERAPELRAYDVFVGNWDFKAEMLNAEGQDKEWSGTASWQWALNERFLHGVLSAKSAQAEFESAGAWGWDKSRGKYVWWMFNDWGFVQHGPADYDADEKEWSMEYTGTGLDGTKSFGCYEVTVVDDDTIDWHMQEWADAFRCVSKMEMKGQYKRRP